MSDENISTVLVRSLESHIRNIQSGNYTDLQLENLSDLIENFDRPLDPELVSQMILGWYVSQAIIRD